MSSALETVREVYEAFNRGDIDRVMALFDEQIEWIEPEGYFVPDGRGHTKGRAAVMALLGQYPQFWKSFRVEPDEFFDAGDGSVFVLGRQIGISRKSETAYTGGFANYWQVRDGKATLHQSFSDTKSVAAALA